MIHYTPPDLHAPSICKLKPGLHTWRNHTTEQPEGIPSPQCNSISIHIQTYSNPWIPSVDGEVHEITKIKSPYSVCWFFSSINPHGWLREIPAFHSEIPRIFPFFPGDSTQNPAPPQWSAASFAPPPRAQGHAGARVPDGGAAAAGWKSSGEGPDAGWLLIVNCNMLYQWWLFIYVVYRCI